MNSPAKRSARISCSPPPDDRNKSSHGYAERRGRIHTRLSAGRFPARSIAQHRALHHPDRARRLLQHREPELRHARQSGEYPPAGVDHGDHGRRPHLRHPDRRDRPLRRRDRQRDRDRAHLLHAAARLREHRQSADARRDRHHSRAAGVRRAWPPHRLRRDPHRHPVLHHDARHDADRRWRIGGSGARPDRLHAFRLSF